jgi:transketolase
MDTINIAFIPHKEFKRLQNSNIEKFEKLKVLSDMCRLNALSAVKLAGSGHLGSSFSSMDIFVFLYFSELNTIKLGIKNAKRDIFFSSKGHDCPGQYSVLFAAGIIDFEMLCRLRRIGGLYGHPNIHTPGIEANSGSLGMGISKAKGIALAKQLKGYGGGVFVLTGDGELQEGQIWEALQTAAHQNITNLTVVVDFNKIQTDKRLEDIISLKGLKRKFEAFGWHTQRCDGHNFVAMDKAFKRLKTIKNKPKILIADTIKGRGVSFMQGSSVAKKGGIYKWHSGAPDDKSFRIGYEEIFARIQARCKRYKIGLVKTEPIKTLGKKGPRLKDTAERIVNAFAEALVELGKRRKDIVVLDADLAADCGLRPFEEKFPDRFIENGIAEQDMVSMAGGLALQGYLPIVNSFGSFLSSRANEQIYANICEGTKIIYVCHYAGVIPAGPGLSHQSLRDISLFKALPNFTILEPCNVKETSMALEYCVEKARGSCMLRLVIGPSPRAILLPGTYKLSPGEGVTLKEGKDAILFAYGPVMLNEALLASEILSESNYGLKVVNMPWLNRVNIEWFTDTISSYDSVYVMEDHSPHGALGDLLINSLSELNLPVPKRIIKFAIEDFAACGSPQEVLKYHKMDGASIAERITSNIMVRR